MTEPLDESLRLIAQEPDVVAALMELCSILERTQAAKRTVASLPAEDRAKYLTHRPLMVATEPDPDDAPEPSSW